MKSLDVIKVFFRNKNRVCPVESLRLGLITWWHIPVISPSVNQSISTDNYGGTLEIKIVLVEVHFVTRVDIKSASCVLEHIILDRSNEPTNVPFALVCGPSPRAIALKKTRDGDRFWRCAEPTAFLISFSSFHSRRDRSRLVHDAQVRAKWTQRTDWVDDLNNGAIPSSADLVTC